MKMYNYQVGGWIGNKIGNAHPKTMRGLGHCAINELLRCFLFIYKKKHHEIISYVLNYVCYPKDIEGHHLCDLAAWLLIEDRVHQSNPGRTPPCLRFGWASLR